MDNIPLEGAEIRQRREELGLTQQRLAELAGLAIRTVVRAERGTNKRGGTVRTLRCIAEVFDTARREGSIPRDCSSRIKHLCG